MLAPQAAPTASASDLLEQYGCGPIRFSGDQDALYERHLLFDDVIDPSAAGGRDRFEAAARSVRDVLSQRWVRTERTYNRLNPKRIYYLSMEFLIGRSLTNNVTNMLLDPYVNLPGHPSTLIGIPFDRPVVGYGGKTINTLRLWAAASPHYFDFQEFSSGDFVGALAGTLAADR